MASTSMWVVLHPVPSAIRISAPKDRAAAEDTRAEVPSQRRPTMAAASKPQSKPNGDLDEQAHTADDAEVVPAAPECQTTSVKPWRSGGNVETRTRDRDNRAAAV